MSGALFQYPGAIIMTAVGVGAAKVLGDPAPWLQGLTSGVSAVGVALVASAAKGLLMKLCNTQASARRLAFGRQEASASVRQGWGVGRTAWRCGAGLCMLTLLAVCGAPLHAQLLAVIGTLAAGAAIYWQPPWLFPLVIVVGGLITIWTHRNEDMTAKVRRRRGKWDERGGGRTPMQRGTTGRGWGRCARAGTGAVGRHSGELRRVRFGWGGGELAVRRGKRGALWGFSRVGAARPEGQQLALCALTGESGGGVDADAVLLLLPSPPLPRHTCRVRWRRASCRTA